MSCLTSSLIPARSAYPSGHHLSCLSCYFQSSFSQLQQQGKQALLDPLETCFGLLDIALSCNSVSFLNPKLLTSLLLMLSCALTSCIHIPRQLWEMMDFELQLALFPLKVKLMTLMFSTAKFVLWRQAMSFFLSLLAHLDWHIFLRGTRFENKLHWAPTLKKTNRFVLFSKKILLSKEDWLSLTR